MSLRSARARCLSGILWHHHSCGSQSRSIMPLSSVLCGTVTLPVHTEGGLFTKVVNTCPEALNLTKKYVLSNRMRHWNTVNPRANDKHGVLTYIVILDLCNRAAKQSNICWSKLLQHLDDRPGLQPNKTNRQQSSVSQDGHPARLQTLRN